MDVLLCVARIHAEELRGKVLRLVHCCWCQSCAHELVREGELKGVFDSWGHGLFVGLSEEARADFRIMKDVAVFTRQKPQDRISSMQKFLGQIQQ